MARRTTTRNRLIATAGELFWRQGYAGTGVNEIITRARATSGSFYHFFATKDDLLVAVLDAVGETIDREVLEPLESASIDPVERVAGLVEAYRDRVAGGGSTFGLPVGALVAELGSEHDTARRRIAEIHRGLVVRVAGWTDTGDRATAELVVACLEGAALVAMADGRGSVFSGCVELLRRAVAGADGERAVGERSGRMSAPTTERAADWKAW